VGALAAAALVLAYAIVMTTATPGGKFGRHLLQVVSG